MERGRALLLPVAMSHMSPYDLLGSRVEEERDAAPPRRSRRRDNPYAQTTSPSSMPAVRPNKNKIQKTKITFLPRACRVKIHEALTVSTPSSLSLCAR